MKLFNTKIIVLFLISFSLSMVALTPIVWLQPWLNSKLNPWGFQIDQANGTLWQGHMSLNNPRYITQPLTLQWDIEALSLILLKLPINIELSNTHTNLNAQVNLTLTSTTLTQLSGYVRDQLFEPWYQQNNIQTRGRLSIAHLTAKMHWNGSLGDANGEFDWTGSEVSFIANGQQQSFSVPPLEGLLSSTQADRWDLIVQNSEKENIIEVELNSEGMATLTVKMAMATMLNLNVPDLGDNLFKTSMQVYP